MTLDPEERKRQRQVRARKRQEVAAKRRKLLIGGAAAALALILCVVLIAVAAGRNAANKTPSRPNRPQLEETTLPEQTTVHFVAGGDLNITDNVVASGGEQQDYTNAFIDVAAILADADLTALNFEGNLCGQPYGTETVSAPETIVQALRSAGVDVLQFANSYSVNQGMSGLKRTLLSAKNAGMTPLGAYGSATERDQEKGYIIREVDGVRIAMVAFTKGMSGTRLPAGCEGCVNVLYTDYDSTYQAVDSDGINRILEAVKKEKPDFTIAMLHWGSEYNDTISESQEKIVSVMQQGGVDAIIGTHSHYVHEIKFDPLTGKFVAYSLGDFFGDAQRAGSEYSILLDLEITKDHRSGDTALTGYSYTPIFTVAEENKPLRILRIREAMVAYEQGYVDKVSPETYAAMEYALGRIESRIAGKG